MDLIIVAILLIGYVLIATSNLTKVNKAAVAIFSGTVGWVLYICYGTDFVMGQHPIEYVDFLNGKDSSSIAVKQFIAQNIFLKYVGRGAEIVLFLLATMTIVEVLNSNGCFDFFKELMKTRKSKNLLWILSAITFVVSANLDNQTVTLMLLVMMHEIVPNRRQRMVYGSVILIAATCGGALTVIGEPTGLVLWTQGAVSATNFSVSMAIPCLLVLISLTWWLSRKLPERIDSQWTAMPYRGDDTNLNKWQRLLMLIVGIGGLWFIPSFHSITQLSPFLGALCVLSVLWIVNEIVNHKLMNVDKMIHRRIPRVVQYGTIQMILFIMGIMLALGVAEEIGATKWIANQCDHYINNVWLTGIIAGVVSSVLDNFATSMTFISLHPVVPLSNVMADVYGMNGIYWKIIAYCTAMGGSSLMIGSAAGVVLLKMERIPLGWYIKNVGIPLVVVSLLGLGVLWIIV